MKVETTNPSFTPVKVTFESQEEIDFIVSLVGATTGPNCTHVVTDHNVGYNIFTALNNFASENVRDDNYPQKFEINNIN